MLLYKTSYSCEFEEERESPQIQWREVSCGYIFKHNAALVFPEIETVKYVRKTSLFLTKIKLQKTIHLYNNMQTSRHSCVVLKKEDGNSNFLLSPKTGSGVDRSLQDKSGARFERTLGARRSATGKRRRASRLPPAIFEFKKGSSRTRGGDAAKEMVVRGGQGGRLMHARA